MSVRGEEWKKIGSKIEKEAVGSRRSSRRWQRRKQELVTRAVVTLMS